MRPLKIYLADLTYTTLSLATDAFPLNVGFIAAYCKKTFGPDVDISLFKYIDDLEQSIKDAPPDILGMSNYPWNFSLGLEIFKLVKATSPRTVCVMGGPNIPFEDVSRTAFVKRHPLIDFCAYLEGEGAFANLVTRAFETSLDIRSMKAAPISGFIHLGEDGGVIKGPFVERRRDLDEIPSPYLTGFMDKFFDGRLSPMLESNRGCPFSCSFCHEGNTAISRVNQFSLERVKAEIDYIADRVAGTAVTNLMFADPNFAMYERDYEIVEHIEAIQKRQNWPRFIFASTGKNKKERIARALRKLNGSMTMWMSVQSMEPAVLKEIKRDNIKTSELMGLAAVYQEMGLPTLSEVIVGLPGDSYDRHVSSLSKVTESGVDVIHAYTCMLLNGTELNTPQSRAKYEIGSHFRVLPRDFAKLSNGAIAVEIEEVVTSTNTMSFQDYCDLRKLHLMLAVVYNGSGFGPLLKLMRQQHVPIIALMQRLVADIETAPTAVQAVYQSFTRLTRDELWESEQDLRDYIGDGDNYSKLLNEQMGTNLIQTHTARALGCMDEWAAYVFNTAEQLMGDAMDEPDMATIFADIRNFCVGRTHNIWGENRNDDTPRYVFTYNIAGWMRSGPDAPLADFRHDQPVTLAFMFSQAKQDEMQSLIQRFGTSPTGIGRILTKMNITRTWRDPVALQ